MQLLITEPPSGKCWIKHIYVALHQFYPFFLLLCVSNVPKLKLLECNIDLNQFLLIRGEATQIKQMCKLRVGGFHFTALDVVNDITAVICTLRSVPAHTIHQMLIHV